MSRTTVTFNGHDLTAECHVSDLRRPMLARDLGSVDVPGMDGELATGATLASFDLGLTLTIMGTDPAQRELVRQSVADMLDTVGDAALAISEDGGLWYKARFMRTNDGKRSVNAESFDATFRISDPVRYGTLRTVTVPAGGTATFTVGGTHPTMPTVAVDIAASSTAKQWQLTLDDGSYLLCAAPTGSSGTQAVAFDCPSRTLTVGTETVMMPGTADWLVLTPGEHTLTVGGNATGGAATVTFYERWK